MKSLRKINIGLALAIIVILSVVIYCVRLEQSRKNDKEVIKKVCEQFVDMTDKYAVIPSDVSEELKSKPPKDINLDNYENNLINDFKGIMKNEVLLNNQKAQLMEKMKSQLMNPYKVKVEFDRSIIKFKSFKFNSNQVTVEIKSKVTIKEQNLEEQSNNINQNSFDNDSEVIVLEKINNEWKIVSSDLSYDSFK